ncbi:hypothetical protein HK100_008486 [Physocladia obscura]|uniref:BZIP domain-containing protein n=1 Tax=Physocladia obscura TaxID=109957 RepID=A0AAD5XAK3_9FUNG|nr:hypothetical protein HK100_008486 [Physocladia obscura]
MSDAISSGEEDVNNSSNNKRPVTEIPSLPRNHPSDYRLGSTKGRKKTTTEAPSHKAALNREAQRALRERKAKYLSELEMKVSKLELRISRGQNEITALKSEVHVLRSANANLERLLRVPTSDNSSNRITTDNYTSTSQLIDAHSKINADVNTDNINTNVNAQSSIPQQSSCLSCNAERIKALICMEQIKALEAHIAALSLPLQTSSTSSIRQTTPFSASLVHTIHRQILQQNQELKQHQQDHCQQFQQPQQELQLHQQQQFQQLEQEQAPNQQNLQQLHFDQYQQLNQQELQQQKSSTAVETNFDTLFGFHHSSNSNQRLNQELLLDYMDTSIINWNSLSEFIDPTSPPTINNNDSNNSLLVGSNNPNFSHNNTDFNPNNQNFMATFTTNPPKTSEQLYGPLEIESFKITLKCFNSWRKRPELVDNLFDLFQAQSKVTNVREARRIMVKMNRAGRELCQDLIDDEEADKLNEIIAIYHERNAKHEVHFNELCAPRQEIKQQFASRPVINLPPHARKLQESLKAIPSFKTCGTIIDQLCCFWVYKQDISAESFFYFNYLIHQLETASRNVEDRVRFWKAYDVVWLADHQPYDDLLDQVEKNC